MSEVDCEFSTVGTSNRRQTGQPKIELVRLGLIALRSCALFQKVLLHQPPLTLSPAAFHRETNEHQLTVQAPHIWTDSLGTSIPSSGNMSQ